MILQALQKNRDRKAVKEKVSKDLEELRRAFDENDADAIRAIFANEPVMRDDTKADTVQS